MGVDLYFESRDRAPAERDYWRKRAEVAMIALDKATEAARAMAALESMLARARVELYEVNAGGKAYVCDTWGADEGGSTLARAILETHAALVAAGELPPLPETESDNA